jgi:DNA-binding NarL/FixJ family response regulator
MRFSLSTDVSEHVMALKVLVADDHRLMLEAIRQSLDAADDVTLVAATEFGEQVLPLIAKTDPDIVVLDLQMPGMDGLTCIDRIRTRYPRVKTVVLSAYDDSEHVHTALRHGASAYISKKVNPGDLPSVLRQVADGSVHYSLVAPVEDDPPAKAGLTDRELAMLKALARGLSNHSISKELWVTEQTVKFHLTNIYRKLGVGNRTEAARYAYQHGLVDAA